jgi:hypothetical protein
LVLVEDQQDLLNTSLLLVVVVAADLALAAMVVPAPVAF